METTQVQQPVSEAKTETQSQQEKSEVQSSVEVTPSTSQLKSNEGAKAAKAVFAHIALMEANGLKPEKLPTELKMKINAWAMGVRKYEKTPSDKLLEMNKKGSILIANAIQDWIEKDLPDKSEAEMKAEKERKEREEAENQKRIQAQQQREQAERLQREELARKERELKAKKDAQDKIVAAQKSKEGRIASILKERGKIRYKELVEILGQEVGESVQVGSIKLLNVYLTNSYKEVVD